MIPPVGIEGTDTMSQKNVYEAMILFPQAASGDLKAAVEHVNEILRRAEADVISFAKWDERRLAYEIRGNKRGVYFLVYFRADASKLARFERDCNLSEQILRAMVLRADHVTAEIIEAADGRERLEDEMKLRIAEAAAAASDEKPVEATADAGA